MGTIKGMSIHQFSLAYQADQDRLLLRVRTHDEEIFELWLTRRMMMRLWQPLMNTVTTASLNTVSRSATIMPEARDMMTQTLRESAHQKADFDSPFDGNARVRPLGDQPMLVAAVDLKHLSSGQVEVVLRDATGRSLCLSLSPDLLNNLVSLLEKALIQSEWGLLAPRSTGLAAPGEGTPPARILN